MYQKERRKTRWTNAHWNLNLNLARYPRVLLNAKTLPLEVALTDSSHKVLDPSRSPSSDLAVRISLYLARTPAVIDASICVSGTSGEMSNVAISTSRKSYVSMYLEPRYTSPSPRSRPPCDRYYGRTMTRFGISAEIFLLGGNRICTVKESRECRDFCSCI